MKKALRRLYVEAPLQEGDRYVRGDDHHYLFRVLRLTTGDLLTLFDGQGREADASIGEISDAQASLSVEKVRSCLSPSSRLKITVFLSLLKGERMEWCIEKLTEMGVYRIVPIVTARTIVKLDGPRKTRRLERFSAVARSAARQCGCPVLPIIEPVHPFSSGLGLAKESQARYIAWEQQSAPTIHWPLPPTIPAQAALLIGPEGGFTEEEVELAQQANFVPVGLGPCTLRAETAAIVAVSMLTFASHRLVNENFIPPSLETDGS